MPKFVFPYSSAKSAFADSFQKCAAVTGDEPGEPVAIRILQAGWYSVLQRKEQNDKQAGVRERVKAVLELAAQDPKLKAKIDEALGRR